MYQRVSAGAAAPSVAAAGVARWNHSWASKYTVDIPEVPITEFITEKFLARGDKPAMIDGTSGRVVTYRDFYYRIGCAATGLRSRGVAEDTVVCIHMPNCPEYLIAFQAVASLGGVNTTSNPLYTPTELAHQFRDSGATYCITIPQLLPAVKEAAAESGIKDIFVLGEPSAKFLLENDGKTRPQSVPLDPKKKMLVLPYSSGTTGLPKGVMLTHYNLVANVQQCIAHPTFNVSITEQDVCMGILPFYHIYGMTFVSATVVRIGATIVTLPKFDPMHFLEAMSKYKVSYAPLVPPIINFLAKHPAVDKFDMSSLRVIFSGAAPLDAETQKAVQKRLKTSSRQGYGMTELSPVSHFPHPDSVVPGSIGEAAPNTENKIVDESGNMLPAGKSNTGELCVRGPNVMVGYLNNPTATAKTIIDGWLHTGDVAYRDENGYVYVVDRVKELIKSKGFQVAPAELEGLLLQHPGVMDCAVVPKSDERSGEVPVAFVVKRHPVVGNAPGQQAWLEPTEDDIKEWVSTKVAEYKQLAHVFFVDVIPKSASGKILRRVLRNEVEKKVAEAAAQKA